MKYGYKAISATGVVVKGVLQSLDELSLKNALDQQKFQLIKISSTQSRFKKFSLPLLEEFCLQMAIFNRAGLTILQSLELLRDATENNGLKQSLIQIIDVFQSGLSLSKSFAYVPNAFDAIFCSMVEAGEKIGSLTTIFDQLAQLFNWQHGLKNQIWTSLQYPLILSAVVLGLIGLMFTWTIPQMADFFTSLHKELSFSTRFLFMVSEHSALIMQSILCVIFLLVTTVLSIRFLSSQGTFKIHQIYMGLPALGKIIKKINLHRFLQVFISLIKANISLIDALDAATKNVQNLYLQQQLYQVRQDILNGFSLSESWQRQLTLDPLIGRLILTGEHTGQLSQTLGHGLHFLKRDIDQFSEQFIKTLEPALIIFLGTLLGWIVVAIFLPLYDDMIIIP